MAGAWCEINHLDGPDNTNLAKPKYKMIPSSLVFSLKPILPPAKLTVLHGSIEELAITRSNWLVVTEGEIEMIDRDDFQRAYGKVVARAWSDPEFKALLLEDARAALASVGIEYPADVEVHVRENNATEMNLVLPPLPAEGELSEEQVDQIANGSVVPCYIIPTKGRWQLK